MLLKNNLMIRYDIDKGRAYLLALYWALQTLTTVGYGDMGGKTTEELLWACIVIYIGTIAFGYIIGMVTSVVMDEDKVRSFFFSS